MPTQLRTPACEVCDPLRLTRLRCCDSHRTVLVISSTAQTARRMALEKDTTLGELAGGIKAAKRRSPAVEAGILPLTFLASLTIIVKNHSVFGTPNPIFKFMDREPTCTRP